MTSIAVVGKKGELILKKKEREIANIKPGDKVLIIGMPGEIIIRKVPDIEQLLKRKLDMKPIDIQEWENERRRLRREMMGDINSD
ncbi:MAG: AbrB/MazE/SpoVT family DNA-binding domain-containing protein [Candidatus Odinarchaeota archaeon]|nr:AbrB/MazE/SpoVT family DNA-binding domain-containing protein [Candidatus Odinarchaeota archaeon]